MIKQLVNEQRASVNQVRLSNLCEQVLIKCDYATCKWSNESRFPKEQNIDVHIMFFYIAKMENGNKF